MQDGKVLRELFVLDDGTRCVVREPAAHVERRARLLRTCALLIRVQCEEYERKMPPPERRGYRDLDAQAKFFSRVSGHVCRLVERVDATAPGGAMRQWHDAVEDVGRLSYADATRELMSVPLAP